MFPVILNFSLASESGLNQLDATDSGEVLVFCFGIKV